MDQRVHQVYRQYVPLTKHNTMPTTRCWNVWNQTSKDAESDEAAGGNDVMRTQWSQNLHFLEKIEKRKFGKKIFLRPVATLGLAINRGKSVGRPWQCQLQFVVSLFSNFTSFPNDGTDIKLNKTEFEYFPSI
jgi:hypothetical protein